jgi:hypothetical protein
MRLRRVYETAEEEGTPIEQVALDRFGSLEAFQEAQEERRILDEREGRKSDRDRERGRGREGRAKEGEKSFMFADIGGSGASSRSSSFRRPSNLGNSTPSTPTPPMQAPNRRLDALRHQSQAGSPLAQSHTPIPSVMTPHIRPSSSSSKRALSPSSLNKLQARALRAKLMGSPDADKLEREFDEELQRSNHGLNSGEERGVRTKVQVLPTLDGHGRLYDVGHGKDDGVALPGNRKKKEKVYLLSSCYSSGMLIFCVVRNSRSKNRQSRSIQCG